MTVIPRRPGTAAARPSPETPRRSLPLRRPLSAQRCPDSLNGYAAALPAGRRFSRRPAFSSASLCLFPPAATRPGPHRCAPAAGSIDQLEDKMLHGRFSIQMDSMSGNLIKSYNTERHEVEYQPLALFNPDATWDVEVFDDYLSSNPDPVRRFPDWAEGIHPYNCSKDMVAMLSRHSGPVRALAFSPTSPNYLASGSSAGKTVIWDITKTYDAKIPTLEITVSRGDLSSISWNPSMAKVFATCSSIGETVLTDLRCKDAVTSHSQIDAVLSDCKWAAFDPNSLLTASESCSNSLPFILWDIRKMGQPIKTFGKEISGANSIAVCPLYGDTFLAATNEDIYSWSINDEQIVGRLLCGTSCGEVYYRGKSHEELVASTEDGISIYRWEVIDNIGLSDSIST